MLIEENPKTALFLFSLFTVLLVLGCAGASSDPDNTPEIELHDPLTIMTPPNQLTEEETAEGFELLFDGASLHRWRGYGCDRVPAGWTATGGTIAFAPDVEGEPQDPPYVCADLITRETYTDFDLRLEWKVNSAGNSGIFFGIVENNGPPYESGPEMQVLDNDGHADGKNPLTSAGSNYGLHAPSVNTTRPTGHWNQARIMRRGDYVEYWLNGLNVVEYKLGSPDWRQLVAKSKFAEWPDYGIHHEGHIGLQDHGDPVWYRNIRIRRLN